jgi:hypothetical protein
MFFLSYSVMALSNRIAAMICELGTNADVRLLLAE